MQMMATLQKHAKQRRPDVVLSRIVRVRKRIGSPRLGAASRSVAMGTLSNGAQAAGDKGASCVSSRATSP